MKEELKVFLCGALFGAVLLALLVRHTGILAEYHEKKTLCESDLSRDMKCIMVFIKPTNSQEE